MGTEHLMEACKFMEANESLAKEIQKLPFVYWHTSFLGILNSFPMSSGKEKAILRNKNPKITFGVFTDYLMGIARKLKIPDVYIRKVGNRKYSTSKNAKDKLTFATFDLVTAIHEKIREHNNIT